MEKTTHIGKYFEEQACKYLQSKGYKFVDKNIRFKFGEIDLIFFDKDVLVFVEVKYRNYGLLSALLAVNYYKQKRIIKASSAYLQQKKLWDKMPYCRFDVVAFFKSSSKTQVHHVKNAFLS